MSSKIKASWNWLIKKIKEICIWVILDPIQKLFKEQLTFIFIALWVFLGISLFSTIVYIWTGWFPFSPLSKLSNVDPNFNSNPIPSALAMVGGIGGVGYLVIKYREWQAVLNKNLEEKILTAITMLGNKDAPSTRIAGIYMLADIANTQKGGYQKRVVNILCGYLRTERGKDNAVESTIFSVFRRHLIKHQLYQVLTDDQLWCDCYFDLHGVVFSELADFNRANFTLYGNFTKATFTEKANFMEAIFTQDACFDEATFMQDVYFNRARFTQDVYFNKARFTRNKQLVFPAGFPLQDNGLPIGAEWVEDSNE